MCRVPPFSPADSQTSCQEVSIAGFPGPQSPCLFLNKHAAMPAGVTVFTSAVDPKPYTPNPNRKRDNTGGRREWAHVAV